MISDEDYAAVKKLYQTLDLDNLGRLNKLYNFQDTVILAEIFERRSSHLQKVFKFNPRKCNSASSFSGCVHREKRKCLIALPTRAEDVLVFERTLIGGFNCVNTRIAFDSQILLPKNEQDKYKFIYSVKNQKKKISTKTLKMDENNQYGNAMTKPLPYGCIKKAPKIPSLLEFNKVLDRLSHTNKIGHLFKVDIKLRDKNEKAMLFNEICTPIFQKKKISHSDTPEVCSSAHVYYLKR